MDDSDMKDDKDLLNASFRCVDAERRTSFLILDRNHGLEQRQIRCIGSVYH